MLKIIVAGCLLVLASCQTGSELVKSENTRAAAVCEEGRGIMTLEIVQFTPDGMYNIHLLNTNMYLRDSVDRADIPALMRHFDVTRIEDLVGKTFSGTCLVTSNGSLIHPIPRYAFARFISQNRP